jgi:hypothetical protein
MKRLTIPLLLIALIAAGSLAARPRVTHDELVLKVEDLEARVKALEAAQANKPKPADPKSEIERAIHDGRVVVGMTEAQVLESFDRPRGQSVAHKEAEEEAARAGRIVRRSRWDLNRRVPHDPNEASVIYFEDGVVVRVER